MRAPPGPPIPRQSPDRAAFQLAAIYREAQTRTDAAITMALRRGATGTAAQRQAQLVAIRAVLGELQATTPAHALRLASVAYGRGLTAVDAVLGPQGTAGLQGRFSGVQQRAVNAIAVNMATPLQGALRTLGSSAERAFELADQIDGALGPETGGFLGRRVDDRARTAALEEVAQHIAGGTTRRDASSMLRAKIERLATATSTDALQRVRDQLDGEARAAFIDRAGRRWNLDRYTRMVVRTTTREAMSRATIDRLEDHGQDLVTISDHGTDTDVCQRYEGRTFSIGGKDSRHPKLDRYPPFHPNCRHYITPAAATFEDMERELGLDPAAPPPATLPPAVAPEIPNPHREPRSPIANLASSSTPPASPFGGRQNPLHNALTEERHDAQRLAQMIAGDPGPEPGAYEAAFAAAKADDRKAVAALNIALGPDLRNIISGPRGGRPRAYARDQDLKGRLVRGELSIDQAAKIVADEEEDLYRQYQERELRRRPKIRPNPCFHCGRFKPRASAVCNYCGDDPVAGVDANDATGSRYVENRDGSSGGLQETRGLLEARRQFDIDAYGVDPDDPNLDPDTTLSVSRGTQDSRSSGARRARANRKARGDDGKDSFRR